MMLSVYLLYVVFCCTKSAVGASLFRRTPDVFRDVVTIMGRSPTHKRMFFKFQSKMTINMKIALQVCAYKIC